MRVPPLYAIVDPLDTGRDPAALAAALLRGGARILQLRWPGASARQLLAAARAIRPPARGAGAGRGRRRRGDDRRARARRGSRGGGARRPRPSLRLEAPPPLPAWRVLS